MLAGPGSNTRNAGDINRRCLSQLPKLRNQFSDGNFTTNPFEPGRKRIPQGDFLHDFFIEENTKGVVNYRKIKAKYQAPLTNL
jgi:hypothetical protein